MTTPKKMLSEPSTDATPQPRDRGGRFMKVGGRPDRRASSSAVGCTGPSYLAHKTNLELTRIAVRTLRVLELRRAEADGVALASPTDPIPSRSVKIVEARKKENRFRRDLLAEIYDQFLERGIDPTPAQLAEMMTEKLGRLFRKEQLYRNGMRPIWDKSVDYFGRGPLDDEPGASAFHRMGKRRLVYRILRMREEIERIEGSRKVALIAQSGEQRWSLSEILPCFGNAQADE